MHTLSVPWCGEVTSTTEQKLFRLKSWRNRNIFWLNAIKKEGKLRYKMEIRLFLPPWQSDQLVAAATVDSKDPKLSNKSHNLDYF